MTFLESLPSRNPTRPPPSGQGDYVSVKKVIDAPRRVRYHFGLVNESFRRQVRSDAHGIAVAQP
jgi:hypothetical protein